MVGSNKIAVDKSSRAIENVSIRCWVENVRSLADYLALATLLEFLLDHKCHETEWQAHVLVEEHPVVTLAIKSVSSLKRYSFVYIVSLGDIHKVLNLIKTFHLATLSGENGQVFVNNIGVALVVPKYLIILFNVEGFFLRVLFHAPDE